jgi:hypothetical protein
MDIASRLDPEKQLYNARKEELQRLMNSSSVSVKR